jgi:predicted RNA polymerase sigma factor
MLQTVLGLDAVRIAQAFLRAPKTMGQRLFRAKTKIRSAGIPFEIPGERDLPERLEAVLEAIYAAFGIGWDDLVLVAAGEGATLAGPGGPHRHRSMAVSGCDNRPRLIRRKRTTP